VIGAEGTQQAGKNSGGFISVFNQPARDSRRHVSKALRDGELILDFANRTKSHVEKSNVIGFGTPGTSFDDIRRDGNGCSTQLRREPELLFLREGFGCRIDRQYKVVGQLKGTKFSVISHFGILTTEASGLKSHA